MDQATLVSLDVDTGRKILNALSTSDMKIAIALWMISSDYDDWRFVVSSPSLDQTHLSKAYEQLARALHKRFIYMRPPILILPIKDPFVRELRKLFGKTTDVEGMRLGGQTIGNRFVSDAYIYQIQ